MLFEQNCDMEGMRNHLAWTLETTIVYLKQMIADHSLTRALPGFIEHLKRQQRSVPDKRRLYIGHDEYEYEVLRGHLVMVVCDLNRVIADLEALEEEAKVIDDEEFAFEMAEKICERLDKRYPWE